MRQAVHRLGINHDGIEWSADTSRSLSNCAPQFSPVHFERRSGTTLSSNRSRNQPGRQIGSPADLPPWQIKSAPLDCGKSTRRANHFRFSEIRQAPKSKIFLFSPDPNQFTDSHRLVPPEGRSRVVTTAGRDAVDARAQGAQIAIAGRDEPRERCAACRMIGAFCVR